MNVLNQHTVKSKRGFALLVAVLVSSVILAVGLSIATITLKQYVFSGMGRESEIAFYAADAGMECALYWDASLAGGDKYKIGNTRPQTESSCMGTVGGIARMNGLGANNVIDAGERIFKSIEWGSNPTVCAEISVTKNQGGTCPAGATCTIVESRGYNRSCAVVTSGGDPRTVERALRASY